jgi:acetoin utilization deacetylase AcuC-like enzyme
MKTGVFYHPVLSQYTWSVIGQKLKNFPQLIKELSSKPNLVTYQIEPVSEELLLRVHTLEHLKSIRHDINWDCGIYGAGACVMAAEKVWTGEIRNAFLALACCHHAHRDYAWGGCTVSGTAPMIIHMREQFGVKRFAVLDTDSHHADGARELTMGDKDVLHVCFCSTDTVEDDGTKIDVDVGWRTTDSEYLDKVRREFMPRVQDFKPDIILHILGHDTAQGDYGDRGLTWDFFPRLVADIKECADRACEGRYIVGLGGGSRYEIADYITPKIIDILTER